jgi:hypothetical protein
LEISAVAAQTRTNLALGATWLTNTNVTNFRTAVGLGSTDNVILNEVQATSFVVADETNSQISFEGNSASTTRTNLGLGWSALTNTNASNFRNAIDLGTNDSPRFGAVNVIDTIFSFGQTLISGGSISVNNSNSQGVSMNPAGYTAGSINIVSGVGGNTNAITFSAAAAAATRTNLGLGLSVLTNTNNANFLSDLGIGTNSSPSFSNVSVSNLLVTGNFTNLGTIYGFKTNVGPFEGIGNFFASNNTTVSNETLFRVGLAEQNDKSAQFGFRVARTNNGGEGFAVFSVFGYNALMMIGPSDRSRSNSITNTNAGIEADIWSISPTNKVMTLITTNTGAMQMHRPIGFNTNASAPANTTNVVGWIEMYVGTNSVRVPYYQ